MAWASDGAVGERVPPRAAGSTLSNGASCPNRSSCWDFGGGEPDVFRRRRLLSPRRAALRGPIARSLPLKSAVRAKPCRKSSPESASIVLPACNAVHSRSYGRPARRERFLRGAQISASETSTALAMERPTSGTVPAWSAEKLIERVRLSSSKTRWQRLWSVERTNPARAGPRHFPTGRVDLPSKVHESTVVPRVHRAGQKLPNEPRHPLEALAGC